MTKQQATRLVVMFGLVSLLADMAYEGARSLTGPLLATLGASATAVGFAAGLGELTAYGLRIVSGWLADRSRAYWLLTFLGYGVNVVAVPLLAFAEKWQWVVLLIILERAGKALRAPSRDAILSEATAPIGAGWAFGLHQVLDQVGAISGPLLVSAVVLLRGNPREAFLMLAVPAVLALAVLLATRALALRVSAPVESGDRAPLSIDLKWVLLAAGLMAAGTADFAMIAYHAKSRGLAPEAGIAALYSAGQVCDALSGAIFGRIFDRIGLKALAIGAAMSALASLLAFQDSVAGLISGAAFWGAAMGIHGSVLKAAVTGLTERSQRAWAFGVFHSGYGLMSFAGSVLLGFLYQQGPWAAIGFSIAAQAAAMPLIARLTTRRTR